MQTRQLSSSELKQLKKAIKDAGQIDFEYFRGLLLVDSLLPEQVSEEMLCTEIFGKNNPLEEELRSHTVFPELLSNFRDQSAAAVLKQKYKLPPKTQIQDQSLDQIFSPTFPLHQFANGVVDALAKLNYSVPQTYKYSKEAFVLLCQHLHKVFECFSSEHQLKRSVTRFAEQFSEHFSGLSEQDLSRLVLQAKRKKLPQNLKLLAEVSFQHAYAHALSEDGEFGKRYKEAVAAFANSNESDQTRVEALDWLLRLHGADNRISSLSMLDGYFTAILISPKLLLPSTWLDGIINDISQDPAFSSQSAYQALLTTIMEEYNSAATDLINMDEDWEPVTLQSPDGEIMYEHWCEGFMIGFCLDPFTWDKLPSYRKGYMEVIRTFGTRNGQQQLYKMDKDAVRKMSDLIIPTIRRLNSESLELREHEELQDEIDDGSLLSSGIVATQPHVRGQPKVGRNDPCPCGSGKKYKKCCQLNQQHPDSFAANDPFVKH